MKKIILSLALIIGSLATYGQADEPSKVETKTIMVVSKDLSGNDVMDIVSGVMYRVSTETPLNVGDVISVTIKIDESEEIDGGSR